MTDKPRIELLTNPYRQIEAWYLYYLYSLEYGELCLAALQAVYDKVEQYDALNKQRLAPTLQEWEPYNFWMEGVLRPFISPYLTDLKQRVLTKRHHPEAGISFEMNISATFMRFKDERQHFFDAAQPPGIDPDAPGEINALLKQAYTLDERIEMAAVSRGGDPVLTVLKDINDGKARDLYVALGVRNKNDPEYMTRLKEPKIYPNYLVHWDETYPTGVPIPKAGVWMPEKNYMPMKYISDYHVNRPDAHFPLAYHSQEGLVLGPTEYGLTRTYDPVTKTSTSQGNIKTPTRWTFIEEIPPGTPGIPDNPLRLEHLRAPLAPAGQRIKAEGGEPAPASGLWFCPNMSGPGNTREFKQGETLPAGLGPIGLYIWYHDLAEAPPRRETYEQVVARYRDLYLRTVVEPFLGNK